MIIKVKSLINESYSYEYDENKTVKSFIEFFKEKNNKDISKMVYRGKLVDFDQNFKDINYNTENFIIIIYNSSGNNFNNSNNNDDDEIKKILEKEVDKKKLNDIIIDLIKKDDTVNEKYFNNNISNDSTFSNLTDEYKNKLNDINIIYDLLKTDEKNNDVNQFLELFELNDSDKKNINSFIELGYNENESRNIYTLTNKNIDLSLKILLNK